MLTNLDFYDYDALAFINSMLIKFTLDGSMEVYRKTRTHVRTEFLVVPI